MTVDLAEILIAEELDQPLQPEHRCFRSGVFRHDVLKIEIENVSDGNLISRPKRAVYRLGVPSVDVIG